MGRSTWYIAISVGIFAICCSEWDLERVGFTKVITVGAIEIGSNSAFLIGDIEDISTSPVVESGFLLAAESFDDQSIRFTNPEVIPQIAAGVDSIKEDRAFAARITGLSGSTEYGFRAYVRLEGEEEVVYGNIDRFTTAELQVSLESVQRLTEACATTAVVKIRVLGLAPGDEGGIGIVYSNDENNRRPDVGNGIVVLAGESNASGLLEVPISTNCGEVYFVRVVVNPHSQPLYIDEVAFSMVEGGTWIPVAAFPGDFRRSRDQPEDECNILCMENENIGYMFGQNRQTFEQDFWSYDPEIDSWIDEVEGTVIPGSCDPFDRVEWSQPSSERYVTHFAGGPWKVFDFSENTWIVIPPCTDNLRKNDAFAFAFKDQIFYGTGRERVFPFPKLDEVVSYSTLDLCNYKFVDPYPKGKVTRTIFFTIDDTGYVGMGYDENDELFNEFWQFHIPSETWSPIADFPEKLEKTQEFSMNGKGYVLTGIDEEGNPHPGFWQFDPQEPDKWTRLSDFAGGNGNADAEFVLGGVAYAGLGTNQNGNPRNDFWRYIPEL